MPSSIPRPDCIVCNDLYRMKLTLLEKQAQGSGAELLHGDQMTIGCLPGQLARRPVAKPRYYLGAVALPR